MGSQRLDPETDDGAVCCSEVRFIWKCLECGRLAVKFVLPFRLCTACGGGPLGVVATEGLDDPRRIEPVREAVQLGVEVLHFYRLALDQTTHRVSRSILAELCARQARQLSELMARHCIAPSVLELSAAQREVLSRELFRGIDFMTPAGLVAMYRRALEIERRSLAHGERRALGLPRGAERQLYWQLAEEAAERAALLEAEVDFLETHAVLKAPPAGPSALRGVRDMIEDAEVVLSGQRDAEE
jgi:hypothetical protein